MTFLVLRDKKELNIFMAGTSDCRHILKTLLFLYENREQWGEKKINVDTAADPSLTLLVLLLRTL